MKKYIEKLLNIRGGEFTVTFLMFLNYYLILVTYYFLKPARDTLFLVKLGSRQLPVVFILIAIIVAPIASIYSRAGRSLKLNRLITITTLIFISNLFILRWLVQFGDSWIYYAFYIWVSIYGILSTSQFWLFANAVYSPTQAKRIFVLLTLGGIVGAFTGGEITGIAVRKFGVATENLLFFCVGLLTICVFLSNIIWKLTRKEREEQSFSSMRMTKQSSGMRHMFGTIGRSRHLMFIVGIITLSMMVASFVDYQFKTVTFNHFHEQAKHDVMDISRENPGLSDNEIEELETATSKSYMSSFFGKFYGRLSLVSFFLQIVLTYSFLRILGVGGVILFLPVGLMIGSIAMLISPGLLAGIILRGADGSFKYSIDKTARELLFMPVPLEIKKRTKVFIDVVIDRGARGLAGGLLLLSLAAGLSVRQLSLAVISLLAVWVVVGVLTKREYLNAFREAIAKREIDPEKLSININEASTIATLKASLASDNDRQTEYALDMLATVGNIEIMEDVKPLLAHERNEIRLKAVRLLGSEHMKQFVDEIVDMVNDTDPEVKLAAMNYICRRAENGTAIVKEYLENPDPLIVSSAVRSISECEKPELTILLHDDIFRRLLSIEGDAGESCRIQLAKALGALDTMESRKYLTALMEDSSHEVACQAIRSTGRSGERDFIPSLIQKLADKQYRSAARKALSSYGNHVLGTLRDHLDDESVDYLVRKNIPGVLSRIHTQESVNLLTASVLRSHPAIKYSVVKSLNKLRAHYSGLKFDKEKIDTALLRETTSYYEILNVLELIKKRKDSDSLNLLVKALNEKLDRNLELLFRLLGLRYSSIDIHNAYQGIISSKKNLRANAVEFLDNLLSKDLKKYILPILEIDTSEEYSGFYHDLFDFSIASLDDAYEYLLHCDDNWLRACAVFAAQGIESEKLPHMVREALSDGDTVVRETASLVLERI